jgi:hypothetical protein
MRSAVPWRRRSGCRTAAAPRKPTEAAIWALPPFGSRNGAARAPQIASPVPASAVAPARAEVLVERADYALYYAKANRRGTAVLFTEEHERPLCTSTIGW